MTLPVESQCETPWDLWKKAGHSLEMDGVRGVAILLVTFYRFAQELDTDALPGLTQLQHVAGLGARGVDLFFVLSGLLITSILLSSKNRPRYFLGFYGRRSLRIFPLYFLALAICLWLFPIMVDSHLFDQARQKQVYLWTYTTNVQMMLSNEWGFGALDHFWSLAVEEHFYLLWPVVVLALSRTSLFWFSISLFVLVTLVRAAFALVPGWIVAIETFTLFRCDGLALGAALACWLASPEVHLPERVHRARRIGLWLLPILVVIILVMGAMRVRWLGLTYSIAPAASVIAIGIVLTSASTFWINRGLRTPFLRWFGKYSYAMYVVQLPIAVALSELDWNKIAWLPQGFGTLLQFAAGFLLTCGLAYLSFHLLEKHFLRLKKFLS